MPRYSYYSTLPVVYVGPGHYSHLFWYSTFDWTLSMQAMWLYNHQANIDSQLYQQRMQNAALRAEVDRLRASGVRPDPTFVPADYKGKEQLMYDPEFVASAANMRDTGHYASGGSGGGGWVILWTLLIIAVIILIVWLIFGVKWETSRY
jgi:hypothetical protein